MNDLEKEEGSVGERGRQVYQELSTAGNLIHHGRGQRKRN